MDLNSINKKKICLIALISSILFIILTLIAMILYTGGNYQNIYSQNYDFRLNFFSDLGRTTNFLGSSNLMSCILFIISISSVGFSFSMVLLILPSYFKENSWEKKITIVGCIFGLLSALAYVGISLTPWNIFPDMHMLFVYFAFVLIIPMCLLNSIAVFKNVHFPNYYAKIYLLLAFLQSLYIILMIFGPKQSTENSLLIQVIGQKIIVYAQIINIFIQSYGIYKFEEKKEILLLSNSNLAEN